MTSKANSQGLSRPLAARADDAPAILAPDRPTLTHGGLRDLIGATAAALHARGIGRGDRVAIVLPNGPEMATSFVAVAASASTAPLNPAYRADELDFYLTDIGAKAILVSADESGPAVTVAERLGIAVLRLVVPAGAPAGSFVIEGPAVGPQAAPDMAGDGDIALLLHTSGTTSRPKLVPLSHANIAASARHIGATLGLIAGDRCLNIMPLFHIHGLIAAVLSSLAAGGSIYCTPGFNALRFFHWLSDAKPSWYTAVPTMHQAILPRAARNAEVLAAARLRFIRSSSASPAGASDGGTGSDLQLPGDRILRDDRGRPPDGVEPVAAGPAQAGQRRRGRRPGSRRDGAGRAADAGRRDR